MAVMERSAEEKQQGTEKGHDTPMLARAVLNRSGALPCLAYLASGSCQQAKIIAAASGVFAPRTVVDSLRILEDEGYVVKERRGSRKGPIEYRLSDVGERTLTVRVKDLNFDRLQDGTEGAPAPSEKRPKGVGP